MSYKINEIFYSIQGEGYFTGTAAVFIRFATCNLQCSFCDTDFEKYKIMSEEEIVKKIAKYECGHIVITGGEPSIQPDIQMFISRLQLLGCFVQVETNGTNMVHANWITCSPKEGNKYDYYPSETDELKYVINSDFDFGNIDDLEVGNIYLQPESNKKENIELCIKLIKEHPNWKLSLQTHKLLNIR